MSEILGATGTTSPINPIRKKELDDKWKNIVTKAVTDEAFKKQLVADPVKAIEEPVSYTHLTLPTKRIV